VSRMFDGRRTRKLAQVIPIRRLAQRLAAVGWFPYKSPRFRGGCTVLSHECGFFLVTSAVERGALIVVAQSQARWDASVHALRGHTRKLTLSSVQNIALTPNNLLLRWLTGRVIWAENENSVCRAGQSIVVGPGRRNTDP
jgi:hypothetical protein